jgi:hypothetical protein
MDNIMFDMNKKVIKDWNIIINEKNNTEKYNKIKNILIQILANDELIITLKQKKDIKMFLNMLNCSYLNIEKSIEFINKEVIKIL